MAEATRIQGERPPGTRTPFETYQRLAPVLVPLLAIFTALLIGAILIWATGKNWVAAYTGLWQGSFGSLTSIERTIVRATPFIIAGLAVALGFKAGLFNIGAEGQIYIGGLATVFIGAMLSGLPSIIHIPLALGAGALGGMAWGFIPGILKARFGAHEVINTIMLNYVALRLAEWLIRSREPVLLGDPLDKTSSRTVFVLPSAELPQIPGTALHGGILMALILCGLVYWLLYRTTIGFELRTVGSNPSAARYAGMRVPATIVLAMSLSGALAGLAGAGEVLGQQSSLTAGYFSGIGFDSIAVALLARSNPFAMILSGLLWGGLQTGASVMQVRGDISIDLIKIVQALIIMFIAADQIVRFIYRLRAGSKEQTIFTRGWGR